MKPSKLVGVLSILCAGLLSPPSLQSAESVPSVPQQRSLTVTLGYGPWAYSVSTSPSINLAPGSDLHLKTGYDEGAIRSIRWFKNGNFYSSGSPSLSLLNVEASHSGHYKAEITHAGGIQMTSTATVHVAAPVRQQLLALATRGTIAPTSPRMIGGFVLAASHKSMPETKTLLIRAVGPSLAALGVASPLPDPTLRIFHSSGSEVVTAVDPAVTAAWQGYLPSQIAERVGAFPLLPDGRDIAVVLSLPAGAYTAHVASASGQTGDALVEIYEVSDEVLQSFHVPVVPPPVPPSAPSDSVPVSTPPAIGSPLPVSVDLPPLLPELPEGSGL